jgi:hypothetical protein
MSGDRVRKDKSGEPQCGLFYIHLFTTIVQVDRSILLLDVELALWIFLKPYFREPTFKYFASEQ